MPLPARPPYHRRGTLHAPPLIVPALHNNLLLFVFLYILCPRLFAEYCLLNSAYWFLYSLSSLLATFVSLFHVTACWRARLGSTPFPNDWINFCPSMYSVFYILVFTLFPIYHSTILPTTIFAYWFIDESGIIKKHNTKRSCQCMEIRHFRNRTPNAIINATWERNSIGMHLRQSCR